MSADDLEQALRNLPGIGQLIKDRPQRQIWRFEVAGAPYILKFYPRESGLFKRFARGNSAAREFARLQWLQKAQVPAPRVFTWLHGFRINARLGDAVVMQAIEPSIPLDRYLNDLELQGKRAPDHLQIATQIRDLVRQLAKSDLGHSDLHLGNILRSNGKLYLLDAHAVHRGGMRLKDLYLLAHSVNRYATSADLIRGWESLGPPRRMPPTNPISNAQWSKALHKIWHDNEYFGALRPSDWTGSFFKKFKYPRPWSRVSAMQFESSAWEKAWPPLLAQIESDQFEIIKRSRSGDVLSGEIILDGHPISVIVKRPRRKYLHRYVNEIGRGGRVRRAWQKAWKLILRDIPTAWPILMMERRVLGYVADSIIVFERIDGKNLADADLTSMSASERETFFFRCGRLLRKLDRLGLYHWDAKASNFIVAKDPNRQATPVLVDVDGIRKIQWTRWSIDRLLRSLRDHKQYTPEDSLALCRGYAPCTSILQEKRKP